MESPPAPSCGRLRRARTLVAVLALSGILLFIVVSVADALSNLRRGARCGRAGGRRRNLVGEPPGRQAPSPASTRRQDRIKQGSGDDGGAVDLLPDPDPGRRPRAQLEAPQAVRPTAAPVSG